MPWMRVSIGVGICAVVAGITGMILWLHDGSNYFDLAVAVALAGFLTLISCVLTRVFGSSHGTQDDAFWRGRSMGYDAGFLEGHRTARPVVVPLRLVGSDPEAPAYDYDSDSDRADEPVTPMPAAPLWRRDATERWDRGDRWDRGRAWLSTRRTPLLVGALALGVIGVLTTSMLLPTSASTVTSRPSPGTLFNGDAPGTLFKKDAPSLPGTPALAAKSGARTPGAATTGVPPLAPSVATGVTGARVEAAVASARVPSSPDSTPAAPVAAPVTVDLPAVSSPETTPPVVPAVVPVVAAPVVPLTAAEQTAADAKAAADLTAANAAAAAAETARVAAAAAEATRLQALADAYAVAHPAG